MRSQLVMLAFGAIAAVVAVPVSQCSADCHETDSTSTNITNTSAPTPTSTANTSTHELVQQLVIDFVQLDDATAEFSSTLAGLGGSANETISGALNGLIQAATALANGAQALRNQPGSSDPTDPANLASHQTVQEIARFYIANANLTTILAGPNGTDNATVTDALNNAITAITQLAVDTLQENIRIQNKANNA